MGRQIVDLYTEWDSRQPKRSHETFVYYDARKALRWMALVMVLPIGIITALALNMHSTFAEDGIHVFGYSFSGPKVYAYSEIRKIVHVHGKFINRPYCVVHFVDGQSWNQDNWDGLEASADRTLESLLEQRTHLPITDILVLEDLPKPNDRK